MSSSHYISPLEKYSFYYNEKKEIITVYQHNIVNCVDAGVKFDTLICIGSFFRAELPRKEWQTICSVILERDKTIALLYRSSQFEPFSWACYKVIDNEKFLVSNVPLTEATTHFED